MMGERIRALRRENAWTQHELAEEIGVSASTVGMYEQNRRIPTPESLKRLCALFGVTSDYLLWGIEQQTELSQALAQLHEQLKEAACVTYRGQPLSAACLEQIFHAMELGVQLVLKQQEE